MTEHVDVVFLDVGGVLYSDLPYERSLMLALREMGAKFSDEEYAGAYADSRRAQRGSFRRRLARRFKEALASCVSRASGAPLASAPRSCRASGVAMSSSTATARKARSVSGGVRVVSSVTNVTARPAPAASATASRVS